MRALSITVCLATAAFAPTIKASDLYSDFSATANPNGVFSYYYGIDPSNQTLYTLPQGSASCSFTGNTPCWYNGGAVPDAIYMAQNTTGSTLNIGTISDPANTLWLDPEEFSVAIVFTAPATNTYNVNGDFLGIDTGENAHPVEILDNNVVVYTATISSFGQDAGFSLSQALNAGDTLTFLVSTGSTGCSYCNLSTGLDGTIDAVPEPSSLFLCVGAAVWMTRRLSKTRS